MNHDEVAQAIKDGKELEGLDAFTDKWEPVTYELAEEFAPVFLRIKPGPPKRLEGWACMRGSELQSLKHYTEDKFLREVRPGDLTREEIEAKIDSIPFHKIAPGAEREEIKKIFFGEEE